MTDSKEFVSKNSSGSPDKPVMGPSMRSGDSRGYLVKKKPPVEGELEEGAIPGKPMRGDLGDDYEEALEGIDQALQGDPQNEDLHMQKYQILKQAGEKEALAQALEDVAKFSENPFFATKLGELCEERFKYEQALQWRKRVVELKGDDPYSWRRLAIAHVRLYKYDEAEEVYGKVITLQPEVEDPLGHTFFQEMQGVGVPKERRNEVQNFGVRVARKALERYPDSIPLLEGAARLSRIANDFEISISFYEKLLEQAVADHAHYRQWKTELLRIYARQGLDEKWKQLNRSLIEDYKKYLESKKGDAHNWLQLGLQQIQAGFFEESIHSLKKSISIDEKNVQALYELGRILVRLDRSGEAIEYYLNIVPKAEELSNRMKYHRALELCLGDLYFRLGKYEEALAIYRREERSNARHIGIVYEAKGDADKALELYNLAIEVSPRDGRNHLALAEYYVRRNKWDEAQEAAQSGLNSPHVTKDALEGLFVALATAKMKTARIDEAMKIMEDAVEEFPELLSMDLRRMKLIFLQKKVKQAKSLGEDIIKRIELQVKCAPSASDLWSILGDCCSLMGHLDKAREAYSQAMRYNAMESEAVRGLGVLAEKDGDFEKAIELFSKFTMYEPLSLSTPPLREKIKKLKQQVKV